MAERHPYISGTGGITAALNQLRTEGVRFEWDPRKALTKVSEAQRILSASEGTREPQQLLVARLRIGGRELAIIAQARL